MYAILGTIKVKPEHLQEFVENVREHARSTLKEQGCLRFDVLQDRNDPHTIVLYEVFRTEADLDRHHETEHWRRWIEMSRPWRDTSSYNRRVLDHIHPTDEEWP